MTPPLTKREAEVLKLVTEGKLSKQIAFELGLSRKTIECHRAHLLRKFGVHNTVALMRVVLTNASAASK